jgi:hypothetical protein
VVKEKNEGEAVGLSPGEGRVVRKGPSLPRAREKAERHTEKSHETVSTPESRLPIALNAASERSIEAEDSHEGHSSATVAVTDFELADEKKHPSVQAAGRQTHHEEEAYRCW